MAHQQALQTARRAIAAAQYRQAHGLCLNVLQVDPSVAEAYFLLAIIAIEHRNFTKAEGILRRAIHFDGSDAAYHAYRAQCLVALNRHADSLVAVNRAAALGSEQSLVLDTIGVAYSRLGYHHKAVAFFEAAIARQPDNASFQYNLASSLQFSGDFDRAERAYEAALDIEPLHFRSHSSLSQLSRQTPDSNHIARLLSVRDQLTRDVDANLHICHALAKEFEDLGDYRRAFDFLNQGKRRKREQINHDPVADRRLFAAVKEIFSAAAPHRLHPGCDSEEPIFIIGMPRTGTTLVERILSNHSEVFSAGELTNFALQLKTMAATPSRLMLDVETLYKGLSVNAGDLGAAYINSTRPRTGETPRFIDKMPLNFFYVGFIRAALPKAKIVCLRRNPLDTCLSNYRQLFSTDFSYYNYAYNLTDTALYYIQFAELIALWQEKFQHNFYQIHYEALVANPQAEAEKLLRFCNLQWQSQCLDFEKNQSPVATASSVQVRNKIYTSAIDRWRRYDEFLGGIKTLFAQAGIDV